MIDFWLSSHRERWRERPVETSATLIKLGANSVRFMQSMILEDEAYCSKDLFASQREAIFVVDSAIWRNNGSL